MTLTAVREIDAVGVDRQTGKVVLTVVDDLGWGDDDHHLVLLQSKLNVYLRSIESGELEDAYPDAKGRPVQILILAREQPPAQARHTLEHVRCALERSGYELEHRVLSCESSS